MAEDQQKEDERSFVKRVLNEQGVYLDDMFSQRNWEFFHYDPQTMRFAIRIKKGQRRIDESEVLPNVEQCRTNFWSVGNEQMVVVMYVYEVPSSPIYIAAQRWYMSEKKFIEQYPGAHSLICSS